MNRTHIEGENTATQRDEQIHREPKHTHRNREQTETDREGKKYNRQLRGDTQRKQPHIRGKK